MHLREIELDEAGDPIRTLVVDQLEGVQRAERLTCSQDLPRNPEEIGCRLPALLYNLHGAIVGAASGPRYHVTAISVWCFDGWAVDAFRQGGMLFMGAGR